MRSLPTILENIGRACTEVVKVGCFLGLAKHEYALALWTLVRMEGESFLAVVMHSFYFVNLFMLDTFAAWNLRVLEAS